MTINITPKKRIIKEFELPDLIPYSIAVVLLWGCIYLMHNFSHIRL